MKTGSTRSSSALNESTREARCQGGSCDSGGSLVPRISPGLLRWFRWYGRRYVRRHFHALRLSRDGRPQIDAGVPLVVFLNHAAWWDPLVGLCLAERLFADRVAYAPIEAAALGRYRFMERLGLFGIEPGTRRGSIRFLRVARAVLAQPNTALWLTPEGRFADPRERPLRFRPGLAHLARGMHSGVLLPLALEYPFWEERSAEALARFGEPLPIEGKSQLTVEQWNSLLEDRLRATQDALAEQAIRRRPDEFETILSGSAGVGGVYDLWRRFRAWLRGKKFRPEHGDVER